MNFRDYYLKIESLLNNFSPRPHAHEVSRYRAVADKKEEAAR
jgi:hypothetical protein